MANSIIKWVVRSFWWSLTIAGSIFLFLSFIPGIQELAKLWNSNEVVDINMEWLIANFNTPIFYAALFIFFFFVILVGTGIWALLDRLLGSNGYNKNELEQLHREVLKRTTNELDVLKHQVQQLQSKIDTLQHNKEN